MPLQPNKNLRYVQLGVYLNLTIMIVILGVSFTTWTEGLSIPGLKAPDYCSKTGYDCKNKLKLIKQAYPTMHAFYSCSATFIFMAGLATACETRMLYRATGIFSIALFIYGVILSAIALTSKSDTKEISEMLFQEGMKHYKRNPYDSKASWLREFVDNIQIEYKCCGFKGPNDYEQYPYDKTHKYIPCLKNSTHSLGPMMLPMTCCQTIFEDIPSGIQLNPKCGLSPFNLLSVPNCAQIIYGDKVQSKGCNVKVDEANDCLKKHSMLILIFCFQLAMVTVSCWLLATNVVKIVRESTTTTEKERGMASAYSTKLDSKNISYTDKPQMSPKIKW